MVDKNSDKHEKKSVLTLGYREINWEDMLDSLMLI